MLITLRFPGSCKARIVNLSTSVINGVTYFLDTEQIHWITREGDHKKKTLPHCDRVFSFLKEGLLEDYFSYKWLVADYSSHYISSCS